MRPTPEIRRWVIGQVFSYAAGLWQLSYEDLENAFDGRLAATFEDDAEWDPAAFTTAVSENLRQGAFRLLIAVDAITEELKRTVVFINQHTLPTLRLLAIELQRACDGGVEILLPNVYGEESAEQRSPRRKHLWDEASLIHAIQEAQPPELATRLIALYEFLRDAGARASWGTGATPSVVMWLGEDAGNPVAVGIYAQTANWSGGVVVYFTSVREKRTREELVRLGALLRQVPGVAPYVDEAEQKDWSMHGGMDPAQVLASDEALEAWKRAIAEAATPAAVDGRGSATAPAAG